MGMTKIKVQDRGDSVPLTGVSAKGTFRASIVPHK